MGISQSELARRKGVTVQAVNKRVKSGLAGIRTQCASITGGGKQKARKSRYQAALQGALPRAVNEVARWWAVAALPET